VAEFVNLEVPQLRGFKYRLEVAALTSHEKARRSQEIRE
jgi:hypothetical protein